MRHRLFASLLFASLVAALTLPAAALAQTGAVGLEESTARMICEYRHPTHPGWNFFEPCDVARAARPGKETTKAAVDNGSTFAIEKVALAGEGERLTLNGKPATLHPRGDAECYRTAKERDEVCLHPAGTLPPVAAMEAASADTADGLPATGPVPLGGAQSGQCLLKRRAETGAEALLATGACQRAENCQTDASSGARSCLTLHVWASGRENGVYRGADWLALDGAEVVDEGAGCVAEPGGGLVFCFGKGAFDVADLPQGSEAPADIPSDIPSDIPASVGFTAAPETQTQTAAAAPLPEGYDLVDQGLCSVTKNGKPFTQSACIAANLCEDDACDMLFRFDTGAEINLMVVSGEVIDIDGSGTGMAPLPTEGSFCLPYDGSPFQFCFVSNEG